MYNFIHKQILQNNLLKDTWIDITFSGDIPTIITGQITNLEEDMIEIKTYPSNSVIYIDFAYKGLPEELNIKEIDINEAEKIINRFEGVPLVQVLNGRYGPFIQIGEGARKNKTNIKIPKDLDPKSLTRKICLDLAEKSKKK